MSDASVFDVDPKEYAERTKRIDANRAAFTAWVKENLREDVHYGSIKSKKFQSKPSLLKPGSEAIIQHFNLKPHFPNFPRYEEAAYSGVTIENVVIRCELRAGDVVMAEGIGGRRVSQDGGDVNRSLKMCTKSAQVDAVLRLAGLSDHFTQDLEDMVTRRGGYKTAVAPVRSEPNEADKAPDDPDWDASDRPEKPPEFKDSSPSVKRAGVPLVKKVWATAFERWPEKDQDDKPTEAFANLSKILRGLGYKDGSRDLSRMKVKEGDAWTAIQQIERWDNAEAHAEADRKLAGEEK